MITKKKVLNTGYQPKKNVDLLDKVSDIKLIVFLSLLCFMVKFLWIYFVRVEPSVDFERFYNTAVGLSNSWLYSDRYIALFPHVFGYSSFLSIFYIIFGDSVFLATLLNVVLSVISGVLIYKIVKTLVSTKAAICAYSLWIFFPSQTIYNSLVLSDPLYTTCILAFVYFVTVIAMKESLLKWYNMLVLGIPAAIILLCINVNRPIAMVLIIAMFIWIFVLRFKELFHRDYFVKWISFFAVMLLVYSTLGGLWDIYFTARMGEKPASSPGYNIYVGFNAESKGTWNEEDSELLFSYSEQKGSTADWAQQQMLDEAINRITSGKINFPKLIVDKLALFLVKDSICVDYCGDSIAYKGVLKIICNAFYYCTVLISIFGVIKLLKTYLRTSAIIIPLYVFGITCAQMLVEVHPRYHYSVIPFLIIISQFCLFKTKNNNKRIEEDK